MSTLIDDSDQHLPPFANVENKNGATTLSVCNKMAPWLKRTLVLIPIGMLINVIVIALLANLQPVTPWRILGIAVCAIAFLTLLFFGFSCVIVSSLNCKIILKGEKIRLEDAGEFEIPLADILSIRHVRFPDSRLEIDISGPPGHFFFRGTKSALEIRVADGYIEFFRRLEEAKVFWLVNSLNGLISKHRCAERFQISEETRRENVVVSTTINGKARRMMFWTLFSLGLFAAIPSGWLGYRGWSNSRWPVTEGRVIHSSYEVEKGRDSTYYKASIEYEYFVSKLAHRNDFIGVERFAADDAVKAVVTEHPNGSTIPVYYDPRHPERSVVIRGVGPVFWVYPLVGSVYLGFAVFLLLNPTTHQQNALAKQYKVLPVKRGREMGDALPGLPRGR